MANWAMDQLPFDEMTGELEFDKVTGLMRLSVGKMTSLLMDMMVG